MCSEREDSPAEDESVEDMVWRDEGDIERILKGLEAVSQLDEAAMFLEPVNLEDNPDYCTVVPFPTDLSTIRTRLQNRFYR